MRSPSFVRRVSLLVALSAPVSASGANLALAARATASEDFGPELVAGFANDGTTATRWSGISGHNSGVWFELDWPAPVTMRQVVIEQYDTYVKELDVQVWDGARNDWRTLQHFGTSDAKLPLVVVATFAPVTTAKLRIGNITNGPSFTEVEVYAGTQHGWCPTDSPVYNHDQAEKAWARLLGAAAIDDTNRHYDTALMIDSLE